MAGAGLESKPFEPSPALYVDEPERGTGECFVGDMPPRNDGNVSLSSGRVGLSLGVATVGELRGWSRSFDALTGVLAGLCAEATEEPFFVAGPFVGESVAPETALAVANDSGGRSLDAWAVSGLSFVAGLEELKILPYARDLFGDKSGGKRFG